MQREVSPSYVPKYRKLKGISRPSKAGRPRNKPLLGIGDIIIIIKQFESKAIAINSYILNTNMRT